MEMTTRGIVIVISILVLLSFYFIYLTNVRIAKVEEKVTVVKGPSNQILG